ncbi:hypothetical protein PPL_10007 [Heterostelium album PN500]|uniref:E3 ubiquitin-protein ligase n=1 Tax=Heterostelium pallidum (strain ATCC 26659 / Pp 5 / PN500) TaxID=670386 RepID=D3BPW3_HETP5|nr:hypothetical protein PPL_10007 [Heterostelium album PN500]EFA76246.1 hypothetical protein PPL_10007 [Heterostelium album PN500]|eukprot:XP_020428379.1 hypothetical protein PPL_10007 [Heterostelium album PN500]
MICTGSACCVDEKKVSELSSHLNECSGDTGLYLLIEHCAVIIIVDSGLDFLGSPYLDAHGEEDSSLKRGVPLFLSKDRYNLINNIVLKANGPKVIGPTMRYALQNVVRGLN